LVPENLSLRLSLSGTVRIEAERHKRRLYVG